MVNLYSLYFYISFIEIFFFFFRLKNGDSLRMHMARHRSKPIECPTCQKVLPNKHSFNNHMIYTHGNRTYACHVCGKEYKKRFRLKVIIFEDL